MSALTLLRGFFCLLMLATGVAKLMDMQGFFAVVATYQLLPLAWIPPAGWALVLVELGLAAWLLSGWRLPWAGLLIVGLHLMYLAWLLLALARGLELDNCGCFGVYLARPLTWWTPLEDLALLAAAVALYRLARARNRA
jgi:hypothetical protein